MSDRKEKLVLKADGEDNLNEEHSLKLMVLQISVPSDATVSYYFHEMNDNS